MWTCWGSIPQQVDFFPVEEVPHVSALVNVFAAYKHGVLAFFVLRRDVPQRGQRAEESRRNKLI